METNQVSPGITPNLVHKENFQAAVQGGGTQIEPGGSQSEGGRVENSGRPWQLVLQNCTTEHQRDCCTAGKDLHKETSGDLQRFPLEDRSSHACAERPGKNHQKGAVGIISRDHTGLMQPEWKNLTLHRATEYSLRKVLLQSGAKLTLD